MTNADAKVLGTVYAALLVSGAASTEALVAQTGLSACSVSWAAWQLRCSQGAGLWTLPDAMLPSGYDA